MNIGIALLNIVLFSPGLLNIQLSGANRLGVAAGYTAIFMSIIVFIYGNYNLMSQKAKPIHFDEIKTSEDCTIALEQCYGKKTFDADITNILEQVERLDKKKKRIEDILRQKFKLLNSSYDKFQGAIIDVKYVFLTNIQSIINKINLFDQEDYQRTLNGDVENSYSKEFISSKMNIYNEYISFVKNAIEFNEEIILKLDLLLLEISRFDSFEAEEIDNITEIKEIDELIKKSKCYR